MSCAQFLLKTVRIRIFVRSLKFDELSNNFLSGLKIWTSAIG